MLLGEDGRNCGNQDENNVHFLQCWREDGRSGGGNGGDAGEKDHYHCAVVDDCGN